MLENFTKNVHITPAMIVAIIILTALVCIITVVFVYAKKKELRNSDLEKAVVYYKTTDTKCLNCVYNYSIRCNHLCIAKLFPRTKECNDTYIEREITEELVPDTDPQIGLEILTQYLLGTNWVTENNDTIGQVNTSAIYDIIELYESKFNNNIKITDNKFADMKELVQKIKDKEADEKVKQEEEESDEIVDDYIDEEEVDKVEENKEGEKEVEVSKDSNTDESNKSENPSKDIFKIKPIFRSNKL